MSGSYRASGAAPEGHRRPGRCWAWGPSPVPGTAISLARSGRRGPRTGDKFSFQQQVSESLRGWSGKGGEEDWRAEIPTC